jgi:outer membrane receptor protein involved in Fe transport
MFFTATNCNSTCRLNWLVRSILRLWVKNLADEEYRSSGIDLQASFGYDYSHIGAPRTYGAEFTYRF